MKQTVNESYKSIGQSSKQCKKCLATKTTLDFYKGFNWCKLCHNERTKVSSKKWRMSESGKEHTRLTNRIYRECNKQKIKEYNRVYMRHYQSTGKGLEQRRVIDKRKRDDPRFRVNSSISRSIRSMLNGNKGQKRWESIVGYSSLELINHLENQFDSFMNWENYGSYWHIDHIKPKGYFTKDNIKECWALSNLRPLEAKYNILKSDMLEISFNNFIQFV